MIRFSKYLWLYALISLSVLVPGMFTLVTSGLKQGLDFSGGTLLEYQVPAGVTEQVIEASASAQGLSVNSFQKTSSGTFILRLKESNTDLLATFSSQFAAFANPATPSAVVVRSEIVGPVLGRELLQKALIASLLAIGGILAFVAYTFKDVKFGVAAVLALFHDLLVVIGSFALLGKYMSVEVDTLFVTAVLTTMSFSVHDTIVVFDRMREMKRKGLRLSYEEMADLSLTQTMTRSLTNSLTIIFMLLALVLLGGESTRWFAVALLIGTISGTYSSPFVATPIVIVWERMRKVQNRNK